MPTYPYPGWCETQNLGTSSNGNGVWPYWVNNVQMTTSPTTGSTIWPQWQQQTVSVTNVWPTWVEGGTGTGMTIAVDLPIAQQVWVDWNQVNTQLLGAARQAYQPPPLPTPEQLAERARQTLIGRNRTRARQLRQRIADRRAERLLVALLDAGQLGEFRETIDETRRGAAR